MVSSVKEFYSFLTLEAGKRENDRLNISWVFALGRLNISNPSFSAAKQANL